MTDPQMPKSIWWYSDCNHVGFRVVCEGKAKAEAKAKDEEQDEDEDEVKIKVESD